MRRTFGTGLANPRRPLAQRQGGSATSHDGPMRGASLTSPKDP